MAPAKRFELLTWHRRLNGQEVAFGIDDASEGTRKLFELTGATVSVDVLDRSLHPHITRLLLGLFHSDSNRLNPHLVFTTHDITLLDSDLVRRNPVWLFEKNKKQASKLFPLLDFSPRKDEALEPGYLKGRYGAIPFVGSLGFAS